jgi:hypothetical protein
MDQRSDCAVAADTAPSEDRPMSYWHPDRFPFGAVLIPPSDPLSDAEGYQCQECGSFIAATSIHRPRKRKRAARTKGAK